MMSKKASGISTFLNQALVLGIILLIIFLVFGGSGGFTAIAKAGAFAAKVPGWAWIGLAVFVLLMAMGGKK